jgi:sugar (pentulose or hexulose) kinase
VTEIQALALGIDVGTSGVKAVLIECGARQPDSTPMLMAVAHRSYKRPQAKGELDPADLWQAVKGAVCQLTSGQQGGSVRAIGIAGMAEAGCLLDVSSGQARSSIRLWHDGRGRLQAARLRQLFGQDLSDRAGIPMTGVRSVAKWRWFIEHGADRTLRWCGVPELVMLRLTGCWLTDPSLASRSGIFDPRAGDYHPELLDLADVPVDTFPPVYEPARGVRPVQRAEADSLNLTGSPSAVVVGHDDVVAAIGCGAQVGDLVDSAGTAEALVQFCESIPDVAAATRSGLAIAPGPLGGWALVGGSGTTGALIACASDMLGEDVALLDRLASEAQHTNARLVRVRLSAATMPSVVFSPDHGTAEIWSSLLDHIAGRFGRQARLLARIAGLPNNTIFTGGAAELPELVRRKTMHVRGQARVAMPSHGAAAGAAAIAQRSTCNARQ